MNKVTSYLKNVGKSVGYATVDVVSKTLIPDVTEFTTTNADIFKAIYATAAHTKKSVRYAKQLAKDNQIYKDLNLGLNNALEDIKSGNFYNQERSEKANLASVGFDESDFDFDFDFDDGSLDDFDFGDDSSSDDNKPSISQGDLAIATTVSRSGNMSAQLISKTVANTSNMIAKTNVATTNMIMAQNVELMAGLRTSIAGMHESINSILKFANDKIITQINNESKYFETTTSLMQENNAILKEMLEMQRNVYKQEQKAGSSKDQISQVFSGNTIDIKEYAKVVSKNFMNIVDPTGMISMLTMDTGGGSMLSNMMSNPLSGIMTGLITQFMPKELSKSIYRFNKSLSNIFPVMISKLNDWKKNNSFSLLGVLGSIFGLETDTKDKIDTKNYNKGAVPFDGITRKAIVDVIPEHLSRIEALLGGNTRTYDYHSGKWISAKSIKEKQQEEKDYYVKNSFSEVLGDMKEVMKGMQLKSEKENLLQEDLIEVMRGIFDGNSTFSPKDIKKNINKYKISDKELMIEFLDRFSDNTSTTKIAEVVSSIFDNKKRYANLLRDYESKGDNTARKLDDGSYDGFDLEGFISNFTNQGPTGSRSSGSSPKRPSGGGGSSTNVNDKFFGRAMTFEDENEEAINNYGGIGRSLNKKWHKNMEEIPGSTFIEKFNNAQSFKQKYSLILGSLSDIASKPAALLTGLIDKADKGIYHMLFEAETDEFDVYGHKVKGLMNAAMNQMRGAWEDLVLNLRDNVIKPLADNLFGEGAYDRFKERTKEGLFGKIQRDEEGNIIKNEYGFAKRSNGAFTPFMTALQRNYKGAQKYTTDSVFGTYNDARQLYLKNKVKNMTPEEIEEYKKSLNKTDLDILKNLGYATGTKGTIEITETGAIPVSEGERVTVETKEERKNKEKEANALIKLLNGDLSGLAKSVKVPGVAGKVFNDLGKNDGFADVGAKTVIGTGIGLLVGGPLIGAGIGAAAGLLKNSETINKLVFGEDITKDGKTTHKEGLISKKVQDTFNKFLPDMGKYGVVGALSSFITPFGPLGGAAIGAGIGLLKNSSTMQEMLFGPEDGLINDKRKETIKKYLPKAIGGAAVGILTGPFGILGNAALGAGIGMLTGTEEFSDMIFGEKDSEGNRFGGLAGALDEHFIQPLKTFGTNFKDDFFGFIKESMIDPLNSAIGPIANEIAYQTKRVVFGIPNMFAKLGKDYIAIPFMNKLEDYFISPLGNLTKKLFGGAFSMFKGTISLLPRAVGSVGDHLRKKQIRQGRDTGSAANRIQFADDKKMGDYKYRDFDESLASGDQEYLEEITARAGMMAYGAQYFEKQVKNAGKELSKVLYDYVKLGWFSKDKRAEKRIKDYIKNNDIESAIIELDQIKNSRTSGGRLDDPTANEAFSRLSDANRKYQAVKEARSKFGNLNKEQNESWMKEHGFNNLDAKRMFQYSTKELARVKGGNAITKADLFSDPTKLVTEGDNLINTTLKEIKAIIARASGFEFEDVNTGLAIDQAANRGINTAMNNRDRRKSRIRSTLQTKNFDIKNDSIVDDLSNNELVYDLVVYANDRGIKYDFGTIKRLCSLNLNKSQIDIIKRNPYIALSDSKVILKYIDKNRNDRATIFGNSLFGAKKVRNRNMGILSAATAAGIKVDAKTAELLTSGDKTDVYSHQVRIEYFKKLNKLGLIGKEVNGIKVTKESILDINGLSYDDLDRIITENGGKADINHRKTSASSAIHNLKDAAVDGISSGLEKIKTVFTDHGVMRYVRDERGEYHEDKSDSQTKETKQNRDNEANERKGLFSAVKGMKDGFFNWFKRSEEKEEEEENEPWWKKLFNSDLGSGIKLGTGILAAITGIGAIKNAWDNEGEDGPMRKVASAIGDAVSPTFTKILDWFTNKGEYEGDDKGLVGFANKYITENFTTGLEFITSTVIPTAVNLLIKSLPAVITAGIKGIKSLIGIGNDNKADNVGTDNDFSIDESGVVTWKNTEVYSKDGTLITNDHSNLKEFYTSEGVKYTKDANGKWKSEKGNTASTRSLSTEVGKSFARSAITGRTFNGLSKVTGVASKIPLVGKFIKPANIIAKGLESVVNSGASINKGINMVATGKLTTDTKAGKIITKVDDIGKAIKNATVTTVNKSSVASKLITKLKEVLSKLFKINSVKDRLAKGLQEAGKDTTEKVITETAEKLVDNIASELGENAAKKLTTEVTEKIFKNIAKVLSGVGIFLWISDFIAGFDQAKAILGIDEVSFVQRLLAALINTINKNLLLGLFDTSSLVNILAVPVLNLFGMDGEAFKQKQVEADKIVKEYNTKYGTNYSKEDYYRRETVTGKIGMGVDKVLETINPFNWFKKKDDTKEVKPTKNSTATSFSKSITKSDNGVNNVLKDINKTINTENKAISNTQYDENTYSLQYGASTAGTANLAEYQLQQFNALSQNMQSAYGIIDYQLGVAYGLVDSSGNYTSLSEGIKNFNKNKFVKSNNMNYGTVYKNISTNSALLNNLSTANSSYQTSTNSYFRNVATQSLLNANPAYNKLGSTLSGLGTMSNTGFVSQLDPKYKNKRFNIAGDTQSQTLGDSGCAPAVAANVLNMYAGKGTVMDNASNAALRYKDKNSGVTPEYFNDYLGQNGISTYSTMNKNEMLSGISSGNPTILLGRDPSNRANTPYGSSSSHYVVATGLDGKGNVIVQDPESKKPNALYPVNDLLNQSIHGIVTGRGRRRKSGRGSNKFKFKKFNLFSGRGTTYGEDTTEYKVWTALRNAGYSDIATAAAMGNIKHESGFNPSIIEYGTGVGFGLVQWSYGRRTALENYAAQQGKPASDLNIQIEYLLKELEEGSGVWTKASSNYGFGSLSRTNWANGSNIETATKAFMACFERPSYDKSVNRIDARIKAAKEYLEAFKGVAVNIADATSGATDLFSKLAALPAAFYGDKLMSLFGFSSSNITNSPNSEVTDMTNTPTDGDKLYRGNTPSRSSYYYNDGYQPIGARATSGTNNGTYQGFEYRTDVNPSDANLNLDGLSNTRKKLLTVANGYSGKIAYSQPQRSAIYDTRDYADCSSFTRHVMNRVFGRDIGLTVSSQYPAMHEISKAQAKPGDIVTTYGGGHTGFYTGTTPGGYPGYLGAHSSGVSIGNLDYFDGPTKYYRPYLLDGYGSNKNKNQGKFLSNAISKYGKGKSSIKVDNSFELPSLTGRGTLPSLTTTSSTYSSGTNNSIMQSTQTDSKVEKLLAIIIEVLSTIANNSEKLSEIVTLLSKALDLNLTTNDISKLSSNNAQIKNKLAKALQSQGSATGMGSSVMNSSTESLANAMYAIARA